MELHARIVAPHKRVVDNPTDPLGGELNSAERSSHVPPRRNPFPEKALPEAAKLTHVEMASFERGSRGPFFLRPARERRAGRIGSNFDIVQREHDIGPRRRRSRDVRSLRAS